MAAPDDLIVQDSHRADRYVFMTYGKGGFFRLTYAGTPEGKLKLVKQEKRKPTRQEKEGFERGP